MLIFGSTLLSLYCIAWFNVSRGCWRPSAAAGTLNQNIAASSVSCLDCKVCCSLELARLNAGPLQRTWYVRKTPQIVVLLLGIESMTNNATSKTAEKHCSVQRHNGGAVLLYRRCRYDCPPAVHAHSSYMGYMICTLHMCFHHAYRPTC